MTWKVRRAQTSLEALTLMATMMMLFGMLLFTARMENQRLTARNSEKRAQIIAKKLAFAIEHACDGGTHNTEHVQIFTWSRHLTVRYREIGAIKGIEVEAPMYASESNAPTGSAYIKGRHFGPDSIGGKDPDDPDTFRRLPITCGNVICGAVKLKVQCRNGLVRLFAEGSVAPPAGAGGGGGNP